MSLAEVLLACEQLWQKQSQSHLCDQDELVRKPEGSDRILPLKLLQYCHLSVACRSRPSFQTLDTDQL